MSRLKLTDEEKDKIVDCFFRQNKETYEILKKSFTPKLKSLLGMEKSNG